MTAGPAPARIPARAEIARKALHLSTAIVPVAWALAWMPVADLKLSVAILAAVAVASEAARAAFPAVRLAIERLAGPLFRATEFDRILGATWLAVAIALAAWGFPPRAAIAAIWAAGVGDAAAALAGRALARGAGKSVVGSVACAATTAIGAWWLAAAPPIPALLIGLAAALAERPASRIDDNLRVVAAAGFAAWVLDVA